LSSAPVATRKHGAAHGTLAIFGAASEDDAAMSFETKRVSAAPDVIAPDGSEVRVLCGAASGSMAVFSLPANAVARAVGHRTVAEIWYVMSGYGRMWRRLDARSEIVELGPGISLTIPPGTHFQFRCDGAETLNVLGVTMPPWPGEDEAYAVDGPWPATV
jgi:mannose-6-phosphate isomerase-like protein (cupin superfamily)